MGTTHKSSPQKKLFMWSHAFHLIHVLFVVSRTLCLGLFILLCVVFSIDLCMIVSLMLYTFIFYCTVRLFFVSPSSSFSNKHLLHFSNSYSFNSSVVITLFISKTFWSPCIPMYLYHVVLSLNGLVVVFGHSIYCITNFSWRLIHYVWIYRDVIELNFQYSWL